MCKQEVHEIPSMQGAGKAPLILAGGNDAAWQAGFDGALCWPQPPWLAQEMLCRVMVYI